MFLGKKRNKKYLKLKNNNKIRVGFSRIDRQKNKDTTKKAKKIDYKKLMLFKLVMS